MGAEAKGGARVKWTPTSQLIRPRLGQRCWIWNGIVVFNACFLPGVPDLLMGVFWSEIWCFDEGPDLPFKAMTHWQPEKED